MLKQGIDTLRQELKDAEPPDYASKIAELDAALEEIRRAKTDQTERDRKWQVEKDRVNEALAQLQRREASAILEPPPGFPAMHSSPCTPPHAPVVGDWLHTIPWWDRKYAVIGGLGWNEENATVLSRAKEIL